VAPVRAGSEVVEARERYAQEQRAAVIKKRDSTGLSGVGGDGDPTASGSGGFGRTGRG